MAGSGWPPGRGLRTPCKGRGPSWWHTVFGCVRFSGRAGGWPARSRCRVRSASGRRTPARRTGCSSRRPSARRISAFRPPGACRGKAGRWFPRRREGACRSGCRARPRRAPAGGVCSWRGRRAAWPPGPHRHRAARPPCRQRSGRGRRCGVSPDTARTTSAPGPPDAFRTGCSSPGRRASPSRGGRARVHIPVPERGRVAAYQRRAAGRRGRGRRGCTFRRTARRSTARAPGGGLRISDKDRQPCAPPRGAESARGPSPCRLPGPCMPRLAPSRVRRSGGCPRRRIAGGTPSKDAPDRGPGQAAQPRCLRSQKRPRATLPHACLPPRVLSPVQTMISVRPGRIASACLRETTACLALRRPFAPAVSGRDRANVAVRHRPEPLDDVFLVGQSGSEEMHQERPPPCCRASPSLPSWCRLHLVFDDRRPATPSRGPATAARLPAEPPLSAARGRLAGKKTGAVRNGNLRRDGGGAGRRSVSSGPVAPYDGCDARDPRRLVQAVVTTTPGWSRICCAASCRPTWCRRSTSTRWSKCRRSMSTRVFARAGATRRGGCGSATRARAAGSTSWCCWSSSPPSIASWRPGCWPTPARCTSS